MPGNKYGKTVFESEELDSGVASEFRLSAVSGKVVSKRTLNHLLMED